jgi:hypothetical protein
MRRVGHAWRALLLIAVSVGLARGEDSRPAPLARYFPSKDLVAYVEFDGIDAHAGAWKKTAAARIFEETATGAMMEKVASQILEALLPPGQEGLPTAREVAEVAEQLARSGFAFAINRKPDDPSAKPSCVGLVLRGAGRGPLLPALKRALGAAGLPDFGLTGLEKPGGRKLTLIGPAEGPCVAWWVEKDDLAVSLLQVRHADAMIAALDGKEPSAVDHPARVELVGSVDGFEPVGFAFLDALALPEMPPEAAMFGLDGIRRFDVRWGYQGEALKSVSRVLAPAPRKGVLAMFDQPTFDAGSLPPLPEGVGSFTAVSIDLVKVHDQLAALARAADPKGPDLFAQAAESFREATGRRLREDVLARVGPRVVFADVPVRVLVTSNPVDGFARSLARVPRLSALIELRDRANFLKDLEALAKWANDQFPLPKDPKAGGGSPGLVRRLKGVEVGYEVALSPTYWPLPAGYRPSIVVGERYAALGTSPDVARQALRLDGELGAPLARAIASLPADLTALSVVDTPNSALPEILANIPSMIQWWGFLFQGAQSSPLFGIATLPRTRTEVVAEAPIVTPFAPVQVPAVQDPPVQVPPIQVPPVQAVPVPLEPPSALPVPGPAVPITVAPPVAIRAPTPTGPAREGNLTAELVTPQPAIPSITFRLRLDPDEIPTPDEIRPFLFPATYTLSTDAQGFRITAREAFPSWNPISLAPLAVSMALPTFQDWRENKEKERLSANLRQIGNALLTYQGSKGHFPPPSTFDKDGKSLLSWRVEILPMLGLQGLYNEFRRDEPWDSPHNRALIDRMPPAFAHPDAKPGPGLTFYRGVTGKGMFFDPDAKEGVSIAMITDGTSNTLAVVEAREAVPWTRPGTEIPFDQANPVIPLLGGQKPGGFQALFVDGAVRFIKDTINTSLLRSLSTVAGGEVVSSDSF